MDGLEDQGRNHHFVKRIKGSVSASRGFGFAYLALTVAFTLAWLAAPIAHGEQRQLWQTAIVVGLAMCSSYQAGVLLHRSLRGWTNVDDAWEAVRAAELKRDARTADPCSGPT